MFPLPPISQSIVSLYSASGSAIRFCYCNPPPVIPHPPFHLLSKASLLLQSAIVDCRRKSRQLYAENAPYVFEEMPHRKFGPSSLLSCSHLSTCRYQIMEMNHY
ncbi:hypothetical protein L2E82_36363 [Cichorium intybus]|uniref:Uncharacterized protein n=1 Tax=Cichorium intybus TaxID=13427 RepID=A0ACB9BRG1_CICIN|nr:hypothetical protein L2E82_36363 [Cichorium intybus]